MEVQQALGWGRVADAVRRVDLRTLVGQVVEAFRKHQLLVAASAVAFRVFIASVVGALFLTGLLGFFGLTEIWRSDIAPDLRGSVSEPAFRVIDDAVVYVLENKSVFWVTLGAAIALWQISRVVRVAGQTLNRIYGVSGDEESLPAELWSSIKTAAAIAVMLIAALAVVRLGPLAIDELLGDSTVAVAIGFVVRWTITAALLFVAVGLVVHSAPAIERPLRWVSFGSALIVGGWVISSLLFGLYLSLLADFGTVYGVLLAAFLLIEYLYFAAVIFLGGLVVDRLVQRRAAG